MMGQAAVVGEPGASVQHPGQLRVQAPGRHGQPVDRPGARRVAVAFREPRPGGGGLPDERVAPVDQMLGAGLVIRRLTAAIRGPAIADEAAVVVGPDQGRRRVEAPAGEDAIDGRVGGGGDMQPGRGPPMRQPVSSSVTLGWVRTTALRCSSGGSHRAARRASAWLKPPGVRVRPNPRCRTATVFP